MTDAMVLRGFSLRTRESYLACVAALAKHYRCSPETLDAPQIQAYLLHLIEQRRLAYASVNQAVCAFRFLFGTVLARAALALEIPMAKVPKRLPVVLTRAHVARLIEAATNLRARTVLMTTYAAGLRVSEVCALKLADIESAPERMCLKVREAKGGKDRYTLLSPRLLAALREYWRVSRPRPGSFPTARAVAPWGMKPPSACTTRHARRPGLRRRPASIRCATALPRTCWRPGWIFIPFSSSWVMGILARRCVTCIWRKAA
jgi:site-specific recombinase XerD